MNVVRKMLRGVALRVDHDEERLHSPAAVAEQVEGGGHGLQIGRTDVRAIVVLPELSNYAMDHSAFIYLVNADGDYLGFFPPGTSPERMASIIQSHLSSLPADPQ